MGIKQCEWQPKGNYARLFRFDYLAAVEAKRTILVAKEVEESKISTMEEQDGSINTKPRKERDVLMSQPPGEVSTHEDGREKEIATQTIMQDSEENRVLVGNMEEERGQSYERG